MSKKRSADAKLANQLAWVSFAAALVFVYFANDYSWMNGTDIPSVTWVWSQMRGVSQLALVTGLITGAVSWNKAGRAKLLVAASFGMFFALVASRVFQLLSV